MSDTPRSDFVLWLIEIFPAVISVSGSPKWIVGGVRVEGVVPEFFDEIVLPRLPSGATVSERTSDTVTLVFDYDTNAGDLWWAPFDTGNGPFQVGVKR
jgi:hypothetical protein